MTKTNALELRQNLGSVLRRLLRTGSPVLVEKARKPVAVLITLGDFQKRFVDFEADDKRKILIEKIRRARLALPKNKTSIDLIRDLRSS